MNENRDNLKRDSLLHPFACKESDAQRPEVIDDEEYDKSTRSPFSRDRDRIVFSKSFRRLAHKTQVYLTSENNPKHSDHLRTRLTHTIEVAQIAKTIARNLKMNEDLVEAISFGHDVGHAPFGHAGERELDRILNFEIYIPNSVFKKYDQERLDNNIKKQMKKDKTWLGNFRHNFQSVRQLFYLDHYESQNKGMNLTYQTYDGILSHTKKCSLDNKREFCDYPDSPYNLFEDLIHYRKSRPTIESIIIILSDEIAQVCHDINDAVDLDVLTFENICNKLGNIKSHAESYSKSRGREAFFKDDKNQKNYNNTMLLSILIKYFVEKTSNEISDILNNTKETSISLSLLNKLPKTPCPQEDFKKLKKVKNDIVLNNFSVNRMDNKGRYIIRQLFNAFISDPRQLPDSELERYLSMKRSECTNDKLQKRWIQGNNIFLKEEYQLDDITIKKIFEHIEGQKNFREGNPELLKKVTPLMLLDGDFMRTIIDYIASMTDSYAEKEMKSLFGTIT